MQRAHPQHRGDTGTPTLTARQPTGRNGTLQRAVFEFLAIGPDDRRIVVSAWFWIEDGNGRARHLLHRLLSQRDGEVEVLEGGRYRLADTLREIQPASPRFAWPALCRLAQDAMLGAAASGDSCRFERDCEHSAACRGCGGAPRLNY
jgi:hypothetical protein